MFTSTNKNRFLDVATGIRARRGDVTTSLAMLVEGSFRSGIETDQQNVARCTVRERRTALYESGQVSLMP
jgi:hypothetical protein